MEWAFQVNVHMMNYNLFPILDSTGWYLKCDTLVCPVAEEIELSTAEGIALLRWEGDTVMCSKWQVSYGPEGTLPGAGRVLNCNTTHTVLYNIPDTERYVAYVRSYCTECKKWSAWSDGIGVYLGQEEPIGVASGGEGHAGGDRRGGMAEGGVLRDGEHADGRGAAEARGAVVGRRPSRRTGKP